MPANAAVSAGIPTLARRHEMNQRHDLTKAEVVARFSPPDRPNPPLDRQNRVEGQSLAAPKDAVKTDHHSTYLLR